MAERLMDGKTTTEVLRQERRGAVMFLNMAQAPVNTLTADLRAALAAGLAAAQADAAVRAIVIGSDLAVFSAGADLTELGRHGGLSLAELCRRIEASAKPVVVAIKGRALGAGLELALAARARIAEAGAVFGLPDVSLGSVPGAGGTQRLPRLVGAQAALRLLLEPASITAAQALTIGLVDEVCEQGLPEAAAALAEHTPARRDWFRDGKAYHAAIVAARAKLANSPLAAPFRAVDCVEAAQLLAPEQGLAYEAAAYDELIDSPQAQGLRHAFNAERRAGYPPQGLIGQANPKLGHIALWGAGAGMAELAVQALAARLRVTLVTASREDMTACLSQIASRQDQAVAEGRQSPEARDADWARLGTSALPEALAGADLVLALPEAGPVPMNAAASISLGALPARGAQARIALTPAMAAGLVCELGFSSEASMPLLARGLAFARALGWRVVFTGPGGPIDKRLRAALSAAIAGLEAAGVARPVIAASLGSFGIGAKAPLPVAPPEAPGVLRACLVALANQGARLLAEGVARRPSDIDAVAVLAGIFPRWQGGPMFQADGLGLLVLRAELRKRAEAAPQIYAPSPILDQLIAEGRDFAAMNREG
jgi:3-hydroxyacyl-CoA dehydrogenase